MENIEKFRERVLEVHKKNIRDYNIKCKSDEFELLDECIVSVSDISDEVMLTAANDFIDFLDVSMNLCARMGDNGSVLISIGLDRSDDKDCFEIEVSDKIIIRATNSKAAAQGIYYLEDLMSEHNAPIVKKGKIKKVLNFSPRIIPILGANKNPDAFYARIAHDGFTAILMHDIDIYDVQKCKKFGLDIYYCSHIQSKHHPDDPEAKEYYASTYGKLVTDYPQVKGIILLGELNGFPSKDPNSCGQHRPKFPDNIPDLRHDTGFYPCYDYYKLVNIVKDSVRDAGSDAEIVFWSYNFWGSKNIEKIYEMIDNLPTDIAYMVTFELSHQYEMDGITKFMCDYSIARPGPCQQFIDEVTYAKKRGLKIYSMTSTGGSTQDLPPARYMPMPQKWIKRYKAMFEAQEKYGLEGMLESWAGYYPSIITELSKKCFYDKDSDFDENLKVILKKHFGENSDIVYDALDLWSESTDYIHSTYDEQYGPLRVGTAYPLAFLSIPKPPMGSPWLTYRHGHGVSMYQSLYAVRDKVETMHWRKMNQLIMEGVNLLKTIEKPSEELERLINLGQYIYHCITTVINVHRWHKCRDEIVVESDKEKVREYISEMKKIAADEDKNALDSIKCLEFDSGVGYFACNTDAILWKVKYTKFVLEKELKKFEMEVEL